MTDDRDQELNRGDLERIEALLRETTPQDGELIDPPADLWDRIEGRRRDPACQGRGPTARDHRTGDRRRAAPGRRRLPRPPIAPGQPARRA